MSKGKKLLLAAVLGAAAAYVTKAVATLRINRGTDSTPRPHAEPEQSHRSGDHS